MLYHAEINRGCDGGKRHMETGSRVRVKFGDIRWAVIVAGVAGVASALGATGAVQAAGKTQQRGAPAVKVESAPLGQRIIGKWD